MILLSYIILLIIGRQFIVSDKRKNSAFKNTLFLPLVATKVSGVILVAFFFCYFQIIQKCIE